MRKLRPEAFLAAAVLAAAAGCRKPVPEVRLPEWQPEIHWPAERWLENPDVRLLRDYVRIPTIDPPGNERPGAEFLKSWLDCEGIPSELICPEKDRCNLYARIHGKTPGHGVLLLNHIDVVPIYRPGWTREPFAGDIERSYLFGRGVYDMKGVAVAQLLAFADLAHSGIVPSRDVVFLAECGEEFGGVDGVRWLFMHRPDVLAGIDFVLNEGGTTEMVAGFPRFFGIESGQGGQGFVILAADRKEDFKFAEGFRPLDLYVKPEGVVAEYLRAIAEVRPPYYAEAFRHPELLRTEKARKFIPRGNLSLATGGALFSAPFRSDKIPGFDTPGHWVATIAVSMPVGMDAGPWLDRMVADNAGPGLRVVGREVSTPAGTSPFPTPDTDAVARVLAAANPGVPVIPTINAFSETTSLQFRMRGIPAYGFTPFLMDPIDAAARHGGDERLFLPFFTRGVTVMREALYELVALRVQ